MSSPSNNTIIDKAKNKAKNRRHSPTRVHPSLVLHVIFTLVLVLLVYFLVTTWQLTALAVVLVLISKWRVIAVRPRFWWANLRANLPDLIVGLGTIAWLSYTGDGGLGIFIAVLYAIWLLLIKPKTAETSMQLQAGWSEFIGLNSLILVWGTTHETWVILLGWLILWANARHFLGIFDDKETPLLAILWATIISEIVWISLQWQTIFHFPGGLQISQLALIVAAISYCFGGWYATTRQQDEQLSTASLIVRYGIFTAIAIILILVLTPWHGGI